MFRKILIATDGSWLAERAARVAVALAKGIGGERVALSATRRPAAGPGGLETQADLNAAFASAHQDAIAHTGRDGAFARCAGVPCQAVTAVSAFPGDEIIHAAGQNGCDLIVLGAHGERSVPPLVASGVARQVLGYGSVPVLMLRDAPRPEHGP